MKKFIVAVIIIGAFVVYSFMYNHSNAIAILPGGSAASSSSSGSSTSTAATATPPSPDTSSTPYVAITATPVPASTSSGQYKDGAYTGSEADAHWGYIQVKAIVKNGKITDVQFLEYPNDHNRSVMINQYADPQLTSEAIQAQSANVDIVSGATDSSEAFIQSLSDALTQAKV